MAGIMLHSIIDKPINGRSMADQKQSTVICNLCNLPEGVSKNTCNLLLGIDASLLPVVILRMLVTSLNLRQVHSHSHTLVMMYQSELWTVVEIRQQTGRGERGQIELSGTTGQKERNVACFSCYIVHCVLHKHTGK